MAAPVRLPTTDSESSLQLDLTSPIAPSPRPCRLDVTVPLAYELAVTLVPASVSDEDSEEDDDGYDPSRGLAAVLGVKLEGDKASNYGRMFEAMIENASRQGSSVNASCTLALVSQMNRDELWPRWSARSAQEVPRHGAGL